MKENNDSFEINIGKTEILLIFSLIVILFGIIVCTDILEQIIGLDASLGMIFIIIGIWLLCGYITKKILPNIKGSSLIGVVFGIIGIALSIIIVICSKSKNDVDNKYKNLKELAELKQNGFLTEQEFEKEKGKILRRN